MSLNDSQRKAIHDLALNAREMLIQDAREHLEGTYGLQADGMLEVVSRLPQVQDNPETTETYHRLHAFLEDETRAGLSRTEAVEKLVKEIAFTHLNRLVAFKMMEVRKLIKGTIDKGTASNAYKIYLVEVEKSTIVDYASYRRFLLWQAGQIAQELAVLFDPDTLASRLFPRERALTVLLDWLNQEDLSECWQAEETVGWVYQFFNENEKAEVFASLKNKKKIRRQDIPAATQLFTPNWIVRFLVQNTLGRTWVQMHPDSHLLNSSLLDYLVPLQGEVPSEVLRPVREISLLDPACGTMHFGLVAFDLFVAMYQEELERAGEEGWLETPSVKDVSEIAESIIAHNIYGIDIDLRAVQLSALALYLKAKALNKNAIIRDSHLACADVLPLNGTRLGTFLREMRFSPLTERLIKTLWERLKNANQFGSLLRLEREIKDLFTEARKQPLLARMEAGFGQDTAWGEEFWDILSVQIIQGLDEFARQQAEQGADMRLFRGEAVKGLRLLDVMLRRYDVVVANPPYSGKDNLHSVLADFLEEQYPDTKGDLYAAFIERCSELVRENGRLGMITQQSFMFLSSYEELRQALRSSYGLEAMAHTGARAFAEIVGEKVNTTVFTLRADTNPQRRENNIGTYIRLVNAPVGDGKRGGLEDALARGINSYYLSPNTFDAIPGSPWIYWIPSKLREIFLEPTKFTHVTHVKLGLSAVDVFRFNRFWYEVSVDYQSWFPLMKGGGSERWYSYNDIVTNWKKSGLEVKQEVIGRYPYLKGNYKLKIRDEGWLGKQGITYTNLGGNKFSARLMPNGSLFDDTGPALFVENLDWEIILGIVNSTLTSYLLSMINPSLHFQKGDLAKFPLPKLEQLSEFITFVRTSVWNAVHKSTKNEATFDFIVPLSWQTGLDDAQSTQTRLVELEAQIDEEVYRLYSISNADRALIEAELGGGIIAESEDAEDKSSKQDDEDDTEAESPITRQELAVRWISYAMGIVLGRFKVGMSGALGSGVYRREAFAVGSLPAPDENEFNQLVGNVERFAYVDSEGGRHLFSADVEQALNALTVADGITVFDENHERDLPMLVQKALDLMLGTKASDDVIQEAASGDLRKFLSKDFFTQYHNRWYRKRPIYWVLQTAKRSYGFVLFHERFSKYTLYTLMRDYADFYLARLKNQLSDLETSKSSLTGKALKAAEGDMGKLSKLVAEIAEFIKIADRIANEGYQPETNWIDDGIILRLAPLWELMPIWKTEPKKYWQKLESGEFDWSHIAMHYWSERVREKCKTNKSFAIAHGHEEWFTANA